MTKRDVLKTVKAKCLDCCCGSENEVKLCGAVGCPLYPIRMGKDPDPVSEARKEAGRKAMERMREAQNRQTEI